MQLTISLVRVSLPPISIRIINDMMQVMMGSQIGFYLTPNDQIELGKVLVTECGARLVSGTVLQSGIALLSPESLGSPVYGNRVLLSREVDFPELSFDPLGMGRGFVCDSSSSPVIDFDLGRVSDKCIFRGRLYRSDHVAKDGELLPKSDDWRSWAKRAFSLCKRFLYRIDDRASPLFGFFLGSEARRLWEKGEVELCLNG
jgi:hypothetical protein